MKLYVEFLLLWLSCVSTNCQLLHPEDIISPQGNVMKISIPLIL